MRSIAAIALAGLLAAPAAPCEDIAVLSWEGKYMLLDGETLVPKDVGNLRWMGVWGVDPVLQGSTSARFAFFTDALAAEFAQPHEIYEDFQRGALVVLANVAEKGNTMRRIAMSHHYGDSASGDALWVEGTDQLLVRERKRARVLLLDDRLNEVDAWPDDGWKSWAALACGKGEDLFLATGDRRMVRRNGESMVDALAVPDGFEDCAVDNTRFRGTGTAHPTVACRGTLGCRREGRYMRVVVDIAENRVVGWHDTQASAEPPERRQAPAGARISMRDVLLFSGGRRLLRQEEVSIPHPAAPSARQTDTGPLLRAVDTLTGRILKNAPDSPTGRVSRVFCPGKAERAVLAGDRQVHLIDLATLERIASARVPFDSPYYVF